MDENNTVVGLTERLMYDIEAYLNSKLPDIPEHEAQEIAAYIAARFGVSMNDILIQRDKEWQEYCRTDLSKTKKDYRKYLEALHKQERWDV